MSALELVQVLTGSGVLAGGLGILRWGLMTEKRLLKIEIKMGITK
jgi:hypothetical protein